MFKHQYNFNIEIPEEAISKKRHDTIFEELLENKVIVGLIGYARSGKDSTAKALIDDYAFHRVAFADNVKIDMNRLIKKEVYEYLIMAHEEHSIESDIHADVSMGLYLEDGRVLTMDMIDFQTEDLIIKKRLRPFIIWYGEKIREINGQCYWINKAFKNDAKGYDKIVLSDVRRETELDLFRGSNTFKERTLNMFVASGCASDVPYIKSKSCSTLLFQVNQLGLEDNDSLTHDCIRIAQEDWLIDDVIYVDPRLPEKGKHRTKAMNHQIDKISKKFGIKRPDKTISSRQQRLYM